MIFESHRRDARAANADRDASDLFAFAADVESTINRNIIRWGHGHLRYLRIHRSLRALVRELSLKLDAENDLGLR